MISLSRGTAMRLVLLLPCLAVCAVMLPSSALAQTSGAKAKGTKPAAPPTKTAAPAAKPAPTQSAHPDAAARDQILASQDWRNTIQQFQQWLTSQTVYDAQQVKQTEARLSVGISRMSAAQLKWFENDLQEKLKVLNGPQAQDASTYLAQTFAVASPTYAKRVRANLPDLLTSSAAQINQRLAGFAAKQQTTLQMQKSFEDGKQQQIAYNQTQIAEQQQILNKDLDRESAAVSQAVKGNDFSKSRDYFPNAGNDGPFGPGTSIGFWGGGFF